ncbi:retroviral-like aspartic protease family protein [uncultured Desulfobacter sp.]|uniref:retroviral-like aspartic protease family protein n=1 Tax=uncultured Desulfobacter sp. TaxID=240139 RepID=UPI002AAA7B62|nr:aspartyl protease family protein [uncultured Desulfobacter sp.]
MNSGKAATNNQISSTIPFTLNEHPMLIKAKFNNLQKEYTLVFDTGAITLIRESIAKELNISSGLEVETKGSEGNSTTIQLVTIDKISVGNMGVTDCATGILSESNFLKFFPENIDGILGSNFLKFFKVTINYKTKEITLSQSRESLELQAHAIEIPIEPDMKNGFAPKAPCLIDGHIKSSVIIDTGTPHTLLSVSSIKKTKSFKNGNAIKAKGSMSADIGGQSKESYAVRVNELNIGALQLHNIPVSSNLKEDSIELVGNDLLSKYLVTIDYPAKKMFLLPNGELLERNPLVYSMGLKKQDGKVLVSGVWPNTSAEKSGIKIGDEIKSINSIKANTLSYFQLMEIFLDKQTGSR